MGGTKQDVQEAFEKWHDVLSVDVKADAPWHRAVKAYLPKLGALEGKRILEIGCGRGGFACWLVGNYPGIEVTAADFSRSAIRQGSAFAAEQGLSQIQWRIEDIQAISLQDSSFDFVISCETVEHLPNPALAVKELARVLKPGGRLVLTTPNYGNLIGIYRGYLRLTGRRFTEEQQPINRFTTLPRTANWLRRAGLKIQHLDSIGHYIPFPGRPPILIHMALDRPLLRWFGHHSLIVGKKPGILYS